MTTDRSAGTLVSILRSRAEEQAADLLYRWLTTGDVDGGEQTLTYAEADRQARAIAARIQVDCEPGDRVVLLYPPGLDFVLGFLGTLYAGAVAVPTHPVRWSGAGAEVDRMLGIIRSAQPRLVLTHPSLLAGYESGRATGELPELAGVAWAATEGLASTGWEDWERRPIRGGDLALLQYTSGSTGDPKGVMVSHDNLIWNSEQIQQGFGVGPGSRLVSWLPHYHDMGLIGGIVQPLFSGFEVTLLSPVATFQQPMRWLRALSHYGAGVSGGPNFIYDLCASRATPEEVATLDLSRWSTAFNGAEPIRAETLSRFCEVFAPCGFSRSAFLPCYGMAEATLMVSTASVDCEPTVARVDADALGGGRLVEAADDAEVRDLVSSGRPCAPQQLFVVDPDTLHPVPPGEVGEVWVAGPNIASGYWGRADASTQAFGARLPDAEGLNFLRTGDLGALLDGELFITGRASDRIIVRGVNHYPQDLERTAERSHSGVYAGRVAAFGVDVDGVEQVVVVIGVRHASDASMVVESARQAIPRVHGVPLHAVLAVRPRGVPKTSSGKLMRRACRARYEAGELDVLAEWSAGERLAAEHAASAPTQPSAILAELIRRVAAALDLPERAIDPAASLGRQGLDSLRVIHLAEAIERAWGRSLSAEWLYDASLHALAVHLSGGPSPEGMGSELAHEVVLPEEIQPQRSTGSDPVRPRHVFLTGATGFLGVFLLHELLERTDAVVHCLVRAPDPTTGSRRIRQALIDHELPWHPGLDDRIRAVPGDLEAPRLGLSDAAFEALGAQVEVLYHAASNVNWSLSYRMLSAANVSGTVEVLRLACVAGSRPVHHVSTTAVYPLWLAHEGPLAEDAELVHGDALDVGYHRSKWVAEKIVDQAGARGLPVSVYRPGFVGGHSQTGVDNRRDGQLFHSFLKGCLLLRRAPDLDMVQDLVPVDYVAQAIVALSLRGDAARGHYNLVNPEPLPYRALYQKLQDQGYDLQVEPYPRWRERVLALTGGPWENPLYGFKGYFRSLEPSRMAAIQRVTRRTSAFGQHHTLQGLQGTSVRCPPFDDWLLGIYGFFFRRMDRLPAPARPTRRRPPTRDAARPQRLRDDQTTRTHDATRKEVMQDQGTNTVVIVGGRIAGNLTAAYLKRRMPDLQITVIDRSDKAPPLVGEGLIEASTLFMGECGLFPILQETQQKKFGLSFYFRAEDGGYAIHEKPAIEPQPEFMINRATFDPLLQSHVVDLGVTMIDGVVEEVDLRRGAHTVGYRSPDGERHEIEARWVVDASGRSRFLGRALGLTRKAEVQRSTFWFRLADFDPDIIRDWNHEMRDRYGNMLKQVAYDPFYSGHHIFGEGNWVWLLAIESPEHERLISVGIAYRPDLYPHTISSIDDFLEHVGREHPVIAAFVRSGTVLDTNLYLNYLYESDQYYSADGWFLVGDAACSTDPLFGTGLMLVSSQIQQVGELIHRERKGQIDEDLTADFDRWYKTLNHIVQRSVTKHYEVMRDPYQCALYCHWSVASYQYFVLPWLMCHYHLDPVGAKLMAQMLDDAVEQTGVAWQLFEDASAALGQVTPDQITNFYGDSVNFLLTNPVEGDLPYHLSRLLTVQNKIRYAVLSQANWPNRWRNVAVCEQDRVRSLAMRSMRGSSLKTNTVFHQLIGLQGQGDWLQKIGQVFNAVTQGTPIEGLAGGGTTNGVSAPAPVSAPPAPRDIRQRLAELKALHEDGLIDAATFAAKQEQILAEL